MNVWAEGNSGAGEFMKASSFIDYASAQHEVTPRNAEAAARPVCATRARSAISSPDVKLAASGSEQMLNDSGLALKMRPPVSESIPLPAFPTTPKSSPRRSLDGEMRVSNRPSSGVTATRSFNARQPSVGELLHAQGCCLPCRFQRQAGGCQKGAKCLYCHHCAHEDWSLSKTVKYFRAHICEYQACYGPWLESLP
eukprot:TRINITY_DN5648_c0_g1_i3.p1 TRINITY_DN5648_c0_g1~~TRINITY_DN5648_c0_g1_i3.p1  ORF type:complete len:196 (+),score=26.45 TRINITY_DN5648_c0_g1_i3:106-693(+)